MGGLVIRLERLERIQRMQGQLKRCPECGRLADGSLPRDAQFECSMTGLDPEPNLPDHCTTCGGQRVFRLTFDDRG